MADYFLENINRNESDSIKWKRYKDKDILPMWVADMDFKVAQPIMDALQTRVDHGVFGYGSDSPELKQLIVEHCAKHYGWSIQAEWIVLTPGVVKGLNLARAITLQKGKSAGITALPVYPHLIKHAPLLPFTDQIFWVKPDGDSWSMDLAEMQKNITQDTGLMLLCNPQNPVGKVYSRDELLALAAVCIEHDLIICSDDIHCDLILNGKKHIPIASLSQEISQRSITLMAPSKTFNIPGLDLAFAIIENPELRTRYSQLMDGLVGHVNILGVPAAIAAFKHGEPWRQALIEYLRDNCELIENSINNLPCISMRPVEATYLAWLDVSELQLENPQKYFEQYGVGLSAGKDFGDDQYVRLNFGCQRPLLTQALQRIEKAVLDRVSELKQA